MTTGTVIAKEVQRAEADMWLQDEYIVYSNYVVKHRALIADDGLKPVNRRILWTMFVNGYTHLKPHVKAVKVVGGVMGSFHPHGDASIADAMARMAQKFSMRVPLVDNYGSVGFVTGDDPAAPRYWEARMTEQALELVKEVKDGAVEVGYSFDGKEKEANILPARWPVGVINGTSGVAVGHASQIPSHNPSEVMEALVAILDNEDITTDELMRIMPGPDFPTGGTVLGLDGIREYYETGSGRFVMRAKYTIKQLPRGRSQIVITELPYGVADKALTAKIHALRTPQEKKKGGRKVTVVASPVLKKGISSVQNLTDGKNGLKIVITTTQGTDPQQVLAELFAKTNLQAYFSVNATVIREGRPQRLSIRQLLENFIKDRRMCVINKADHRLEKIKARLVQLNAILAALVDIDKCVAIIRESDSVEDASKSLQKEFTITEKQAEYLLSMQLRRLTKADTIATQSEKEQLELEAEKLNALLESLELIDAEVKREILETKKVIDDPRRTKIVGLTEEELKQAEKDMKAAAKDANKNLPCYVSRFANGTLLRTEEAFTYPDTAMSFIHSPLIEHIKVKTNDEIVVVLSTGIGYRMPVKYLMQDKPVNKELLGLKDESGHIVGICKTELGRNDQGLAVATKNGGIKLTNPDFPVSKNTFPVITLEDGDTVVDCRWVGYTLKSSEFVMVSDAGKVIAFDCSTMKATGSNAKAIRGMNIGKNDSVIAFSWVSEPRGNNTVLTLSDARGVKQMPLTEVPRKGRGTQGVATQPMRAGERTLVSAFIGRNAVVAADNKTYNAIMPPSQSKRGTRSVSLPLDVVFGSFKYER